LARVGSFALSVDSDKKADNQTAWSLSLSISCKASYTSFDLIFAIFLQ
jgi:hypothetical protein